MIEIVTEIGEPLRGSFRAQGAPETLHPSNSFYNVVPPDVFIRHRFLALILVFSESCLLRASCTLLDVLHAVVIP
jgi:hypothetical protein